MSAGKNLLTILNIVFVIECLVCLVVAIVLFDIDFALAGTLVLILGPIVFYFSQLILRIIAEIADDTHALRNHFCGLRPEDEIDDVYDKISASKNKGKNKAEELENARYFFD